MSFHTNKPELIILIGGPCSGKTTWAKNMLLTKTKIVRFARNEFNASLKSDIYAARGVEEIVDVMIDSAIVTALNLGMDVILDDTHTIPMKLRHYVESFQDLAEISYKIFDVNPEQLKKRAKARFNKTGLLTYEAEIDTCCAVMKTLIPAYIASTGLKEFIGDEHLYLGI